MADRPGLSAAAVAGGEHTIRRARATVRLLTLPLPSIPALQRRTDNLKALDKGTARTRYCKTFEFTYINRLCHSRESGNPSILMAYSHRLWLERQERDVFLKRSGSDRKGPFFKVLPAGPDWLLRTAAEGNDLRSAQGFELTTRGFGK
jgi:hypothetical protein